MSLARGRRIALFALLLAACAHTPEPGGEGTSALFGHVTVQVLNPLGRPIEIRERGVMLSIWAKRPGQKQDDYFQLTTDRAGWFYRDRLPPGQYRITAIRAPAWRETVQAQPQPELAFTVMETELGVGPGGLRVDPVDEGSAATRLELGPGEVKYVGHLELSFQETAFEESEGCISRSVLLPGSSGELYWSSREVGARLCVERQLEAAEVFLSDRK